MTPRKAFNFYYGMNLHFTSKSYSVIKYGTSTKTANAKFDSMSTEQKFRFDWLSSKCKETQDLVYLLIGNQFASISTQYGSKDEILSAYLKFKSRRESMSYSLKSIIGKYVDSGSEPVEKAILKFFISEYPPELILLLCYNTDKLDELYNAPNFSWAKDKILKLIKYQDFFNSQKYIHLLETQ